jgi:hypothetical protein
MGAADLIQSFSPVSLVHSTAMGPRKNWATLIVCFPPSPQDIRAMGRVESRSMSKSKPGRKSKLLKLTGDWRETVTKGMTRPVGGWSTPMDQGKAK